MFDFDEGRTRGFELAASEDVFTVCVTWWPPTFRIVGKQGGEKIFVRVGSFGFIPVLVGWVRF